MNNNLGPLNLLPSGNAWEERQRVISRFLQNHFGGYDEPLQVLEAGCGQAWHLDLGKARLEITGVDADAAALEARVREVDDLAHSMVGDLRDLEFPPNRFDLVYSCEVLEHINGAEGVLERFMTWLKPGGIAIVIFPDRETVFGWATRLSPHWVHVAYHRYVLGAKEAGSPGFAPYRTYYDKVISRRGIQEFCATHGYKIVLEYGRPPGKGDWPGWFLGGYRIFAPAITAVTGGAIASTHIGLVYALQKP